MILELLEYLMTPCSSAAKSMGFLSSTMQVRARYKRCRRAWKPHIEQSRDVILDAVRRCRSRRKVVVFGAGMLHDIPVKELAGAFHEVVLVDIVHPWSSRRALRRFQNVTQVCADVTESMEQLLQIAHLSGAALPISRPMRFVYDPELDLTLSVNLLSQLPYVPVRYLSGSRDPAAIEAYAKHLVEAHLDYLCRLPGHVALITDTVVRRMTRKTNYVEEWDALYGAKLPPAESTWEWRLAPSPEVARGVDVYTKVAAYVDWKKAVSDSPPETG
jgi:hypothetical protein